MAKKTTFDLARSVLKTIKDKPKSINEIGDEVKTDWDTARKTLEFLSSIGQVEEFPEENKRMFRARIHQVGGREDTVFNLPLTDKQDNIINYLFSSIRKAWIAKTGAPPNKTQVQKSVVYVVESCKLKDVPIGWYFFGEMCVKQYDPAMEYPHTNIPDNSRVDECIIEVVDKKSKFNNTRELRMDHYKQKENYLYLTKERLNDLPVIKFNETNKNVLRSLLTDFAVYFKRYDDNEDVIKILNDFVSTTIYLLKTKNESELDKARDDLYETYDSVWKLVGAYNMYRSLYTGGWYERETMSPYVEPTIRTLSSISREYVDNLSDLRSPIPEGKEFDGEKVLKTFRGSVKDIKESTREERRKTAEKFLEEDSDILRKYNLN